MDAKTIIQQLGGPSAAARFFECRPSAVSQWKRNNRIPNARMLHLKAARPDLLEAFGAQRGGGCLVDDHVQFVDAEAA